MLKNKLAIFLLLVIVIAGGCEELLEKSLTDKKVTLQAPVNNLTTTDSIHNFYWQEVDGALEYQLQIVSPRFDSIVKLIADTPVTAVVLNIELDAGKYQWRVRAKNNSTVSNYSEPWNLTIQ
jgi:hypothetical protein